MPENRFSAASVTDMSRVTERLAKGHPTFHPVTGSVGTRLENRWVPNRNLKLWLWILFFRAIAGSPFS